MPFLRCRAPSGRFDTSKGRLQKGAQTVCGPEERPTAGQGPEPGMRDGGEEGRGCFEVGAEAESWSCEAPWNLTGARGPARNSQGEGRTVGRRAGRAAASFLVESDAGGEGADSG